MELIEQWRAKIPGMECIKGCSACCGIVPWSDMEAERISRKGDSVTLPKLLEVAQTKCGFVNPTGCNVYEERPLMCRLYGVVEDLQCPYGKKPQTYLTREQAGEILQQYFSLFRKGDKNHAFTFRCPC